MAGRSGSLPVARGAEFDVQRAQVLPPEIVKRRELVLAARVIQPTDGQLASLPVDQPEEPPGAQGLGDVLGDSVAGPGLADGRRLGPGVGGDHILGDDPAVRRGQGGGVRDLRIRDLVSFQLVHRGQPRAGWSGPWFSEIPALTVHTGSAIHAWPEYALDYDSARLRTKSRRSTVVKTIGQGKHARGGAGKAEPAGLPPPGPGHRSRAGRVRAARCEFSRYRAVFLCPGVCHLVSLRAAVSRCPRTYSGRRQCLGTVGVYRRPCEHAACGVLVLQQLAEKQIDYVAVKRRAGGP